ncbi:MAG TPA: histidine phosphatase family protein, partial [Micromonosporaceae bacterium]
DALANAAMDGNLPQAQEVTAAAAAPTRSWAPPAAPATRLVLVRHGETDLTAQRRYSGRGDVSLTARGLDQARRAGTRLTRLTAPQSPDASTRPVAAVVCSPLQRCRQTAEAIAQVTGNPPVVAEPELIECDFGVWEGLTFGEVRERWPDELNRWLASTSQAPPGGESFDAVATRTSAAVSRLRAGHPGELVVVVSHVTPIKLILREALAAGDTFLYRLYLDPAGISIVDFWADGGIAVRAVNDTAHLDQP